MGIAESTPSSEVEEVVELYDDDPTYPWLPIIEYVADRLPNNFVRTYDFEAIREIVLEASIIPFNINKMTNKTIPKELDHDEIEFASAILQKDKKLKKMRYTYVPSIVEEDIFWTLYFDRLYSRIGEYLTRNAESSSGDGQFFKAKEEGFLDVLSLKHERIRHVASVILCPLLVLDAVFEEDDDNNNNNNSTKKTNKQYSSATFSSKRFSAIEQRHILKWFRSIDNDMEKVDIIETWFANHKSTYRLGDYCATCYEFFIRAYYGDLDTTTITTNNNNSENTNAVVLGSDKNDIYTEMAFTTPIRGDPEKINSKSTIGELDILLLNKNDNKLYHEELSIKYMLLHLDDNISNNNDNSISFDNFIGPHKSETLKDKVVKMQKQSKLLQHPRSKDIVERIFNTFQFDLDNNNVVTACILKGWLFYPLKMLYQEKRKRKSINNGTNNNNNNNEELNTNEMSLELTSLLSVEKDNKKKIKTSTFVSNDNLLNLNECHWYGWYTDSLDELNTIFCQNKSHRWVILPKLLWVAPLRVDGQPPESKERKQMKILFVPNEEGNNNNNNQNRKKKNDKISKTDVELLRDDDLYAKVKEQQENSRKENKIRTGRILVAELRWDPYLYAWLEISRGFIVEKNWKEI